MRIGLCTVSPTAHSSLSCSAKLDPDSRGCHHFPEAKDERSTPSPESIRVLATMIERQCNHAATPSVLNYETKHIFKNQIHPCPFNESPRQTHPAGGRR